MSEEDKLKTNNEKVTINDYYYYYLLKCENALNELESYLEQQWLEWKDDYDDGIVAMANEDKTVLDKLKELKENNNGKQYI